MGLIVLRSRLALLAASLFSLYSVLTLSGTGVLLRGRAYTSSERVVDAVFVALTIAIVVGLLRDRVWAGYLALAWTGLRLLWRLIVVGVSMYKEHLGSAPFPEGPRIMTLLMLALLVAVVAALMRLVSLDRTRGAP